MVGPTWAGACRSVPLVVAGVVAAVTSCCPLVVVASEESAYRKTASVLAADIHRMPIAGRTSLKFKFNSIVTTITHDYVVAVAVVAPVVSHQL